MLSCACRLHNRTGNPCAEANRSGESSRVLADVPEMISPGTTGTAAARTIGMRQHGQPSDWTTEFSSRPHQRLNKRERRRAAKRTPTTEAETQGRISSFELMQRGRKDSGRHRKRRKIEPKRPTYLSCAKLLELDHDQLVGEIYMRMLPSQFRTAMLTQQGALRVIRTA